MDEREDCVICKRSLKEGNLPVVKLGEKGSSGVNRASVERNDPTVCTVPGQQVHQDCRRIYCNPIKIAQSQKQGSMNPAETSTRPVLRSEEALVLVLTVSFAEFQ